MMFQAPLIDPLLRHGQIHRNIPGFDGFYYGNYPILEALI